MKPLLTKFNICFFFKHGGTIPQALVYFGIHDRLDGITTNKKQEKLESRFHSLFLNLRAKKFLGQMKPDGPYYTLRGNSAFRTASAAAAVGAS
jgi:hypothetical protein